VSASFDKLRMRIYPIRDDLSDLMLSLSKHEVEALFSNPVTSGLDPRV
jgi:hypothetical protein